MHGVPFVLHCAYTHKSKPYFLQRDSMATCRFGMCETNAIRLLHEVNRATTSLPGALLEYTPGPVTANTVDT